MQISGQNFPNMRSAKFFMCVTEGTATAYRSGRRIWQGNMGLRTSTPVFAIHKKGHYGGIVGRAFSDWKEYEALVKEVRERGGNFIKVMFSGIMDFSNCGAVTEPPLLQEEIREMIHIAHEEGFAVMAHVNGAGAVKDAVEAGVDSVEHGNFMDGSMPAGTGREWDSLGADICDDHKSDRGRCGLTMMRSAA